MLMATARINLSPRRLQRLIVLWALSLVSAPLLAAPTPEPAVGADEVTSEQAQVTPAQADEAPPAAALADAPAPTLRARPRAIAPSPAPAAAGGDALPGCDAEALNAEQRGALVNIMREGPCLCAPDRSLLACTTAFKVNDAL